MGDMGNKGGNCGCGSGGGKTTTGGTGKPAGSCSTTTTQAAPTSGPKPTSPQGTPNKK